jgi:hypothetical protein
VDCSIDGGSAITLVVAISSGLLDCTGVVALGVDGFLFEDNRFSFRFGVSVDLIGVEVIGEAAVAVVDRLGVLNFGNGGLSFFCLLTSLSIEMSAMQLAVIPVLAMLAGRGLRAELTERR